MTHTLKEIVKGPIAYMTYVCEGKVYYEIAVENSIYQLELDSTSDEWKATYLYKSFEAITLMRWIRKGMTDGKTFIQIK